MKKPFLCVVGGSEVAIFCTLALDGVYGQHWTGPGDSGSGRE
jgi:hypothetical protein